MDTRIALVTGGSLGIGRATVLALAADGIDVAFTYLGYRRSAKEVSDLIGLVHGAGRRCIAIEADVANYDTAQEVVRRVVAELGGLHILVNNAGVSDDGVLWKMGEAQWDRVIGVNLKGCFNYLHAVSALFREQKSGRIVNVSSINGMRGKFGLSNYAASKAGVIGLTKVAAKELGKYHVNVNAVAPGMIATDLTAGIAEEAKAQAMAEIVLGHFGTPEDVANLITFLVSDKAGHITGEVIKVDGGQYI